jgi:hypothetical protein
MGSLSKKQPSNIVQNVGTNSVQNEPPKQVECAGWCGEVYQIDQLTEYRKKMYCHNCLEIKQNELKKVKPAGLTEDAVNALIQKALDEYKRTIPLAVEVPLNPVLMQLRDLVVAAKTIMGHFVGLDGQPGLARFTSMRQNGRQGADMRAWITQADKILEGK